MPPIKLQTFYDKFDDNDNSHDDYTEISYYRNESDHLSSSQRLREIFLCFQGLCGSLPSHKLINQGTISMLPRYREGFIYRDWLITNSPRVSPHLSGFKVCT